MTHFTVNSLLIFFHQFFFGSDIFEKFVIDVEKILNLKFVRFVLVQLSKMKNTYPDHKTIFQSDSFSCLIHLLSWR